jgi:hypothetical protein
MGDMRNKIQSNQEPIFGAMDMQIPSRSYWATGKVLCWRNTSVQMPNH